MQIVYAAGVFDILHYGHIKYLREARALGDFLVVGLLTDEGTAAYKSSPPVMNYRERFLVLHGIKYVDYIIEQDNTDPTKTLHYLWSKKRDIFPNIMVRANDTKTPVPGQKFLEWKGGRVVILPYTRSISSTNIKERIRCQKSS